MKNKNSEKETDQGSDPSKMTKEEIEAIPLELQTKPMHDRLLELIKEEKAKKAAQEESEGEDDRIMKGYEFIRLGLNKANKHGVFDLAESYDMYSSLKEIRDYIILKNNEKQKAT